MCPVPFIWLWSTLPKSEKENTTAPVVLDFRNNIIKAPRDRVLSC